MLLVGCIVAQNNLPEVILTTPATQICANNAGISFFDDVKVIDPDGDFMTIVGVYTTTPTSVNPSGIYGYDNNPLAGESHFNIYGDALVAGTISLSIDVTDGIDTVNFILPDVTSYQPVTVDFTFDTLVICSSYGIINLNEYVNLSGGTFSSWNLEWDSSDGLVNYADLFWSEGSYANLEYAYLDNGCITTGNAGMIYFSSPTVTLSGTNTNCGSSVGSATATISGGASVSSILWSNGITNQTTISNLSSGQYTISVTDENTCHVEQNVTVGVNGVTITPTVSSVQCFGQSNGSITVNSTGLASPVSYVWSSGHTGSAVTGLPAGAYTVYATDANNCAVSQVIQVTQPDRLDAAWNYTNPTCGASDGIMQVDLITGGVGPYTVQWSNGSTNNPEFNVPFGLYSATITDANGCQTIHPYYMSESNSADLYGTIVPTPCGQNQGAIDVDYYILSGDPVQSITWSNGATTEDISNLAPATYVCTLTVANVGCKAIKGWNIPIVKPLRQDICVVTVDSLTTTNLVVWEKVQPVGIAYYKIYRETSIQSEFILIDTVDATNLSIFNDVIASPSERSWSYKIGAVNACDVESTLSPSHKTIHLDLVDNGSTVTVNWNAYMGTQFTSYKVWRNTDANGWEEIASVPNTVLTYTDPIPYSTPGLDYMVEFELTTPCSAEKAQDFNTVRSNRERGQFAIGEGVEGTSSNSLDENYLNNIQIYPNPTTDQVTFVQEGNEKVTYSILSLSGQLMQTNQSNQTNTVLDLSSLTPGIYLVELKMNNLKITKRVVKL